MQFTSGIVEQAVEALSSFPGIGKRTALRLVMYLLKRPEMEVANLASALLKLKTELHLCEICGNVSDHKRCDVCKNPRRSEGVICIVEDFSDLMAIESTAQFKGKYHVLGGLISPMDGIGPDDLNISMLISRVENGLVEEVMMALSATVEGDTTMFYLAKKLKPFGVTVTCIARGIAVGGEIEYADEVTLGRSIAQRTEYLL
ncbi:MAG: recombination mediator RecR [Bacteroidetes bacterium]|jgi:recombination protein RecR|nr:recombination mediator RecR [Bacteroidota bacterium]